MSQGGKGHEPFCAVRWAGGDPRSFDVLIIDDNEDDQQLMAINLGKIWPFESDLSVEYASDGATALEKIGRTRFALVILDWKMPLMGGREILLDIRRSGARIPVVVVSGLQREAIGEELESLQAAYLSKDEMVPDKLRDAITGSLRLLGLAGASV